MIGINNPKKMLRVEILKSRESLTSEDAGLKSRAIIERLMQMDEFVMSSLIMSYVDFRNEVVTRELITRCFKLGKKVAVPVVVDLGNGKKEIFPSEISSLENDLTEGTFGVLEPRKNMLRPVSAENIDLVVVPGVVFDKGRQRIGYGAGYYDRFLNKLRSDCLKVGVAFDLQMVDKIPSEKHDIPVDVVITESGIIKV